MSKNYPNNYPNNYFQEWILEGNGNYITLVITDMDIEYCTVCTEPCSYDNLQVRPPKVWTIDDLKIDFALLQWKLIVFSTSTNFSCVHNDFSVASTLTHHLPLIFQPLIPVQTRFSIDAYKLKINFFLPLRHENMSRELHKRK